jgi:MFS family permease
MLAVVFVTRVSMGFQFQSIAAVGPFLVEEFGLSYAQLGWLMGLFMLPGAAVAMPGGLLGRRFGHRRVVVAGLALMALGGLATAASSTFLVACGGRVVSGVGGVLLNVLLAKMVAEWFAGQEISTAMGVMLSAWPAGIGLAVATLGAVATLSSWRVAVYATAAAAVLAILLMGTLYRDAPVAVTGDPDPGQGRLSTRELRLALTAGVAWCAINASFIVLASFGPSFLLTRGVAIAEAGLIVSVAMWVSILSVPLGGYLADRLGNADLVIGAGCLGLALAMLALALLPGAVLWLVLVGLLIGGPPGSMMALLPRALPAVRLAAGLGVYYTVFYLGVAAAQPVAGFVRDLSGDAAAPIYFAAAVMAATVPSLGVFRRLERRAV